MKTMKHSIHFGAGVLLVTLALQFPATAMARDSKQRQPIADAMETDTAKTFVGVDFYFGEQPHAPIKRTIGTYTTKRTTNAFGKSDAKACQWGFLSGLKTLYERALSEGGDAVVNIKSITDGTPLSSDSEFVCRAGNVVAKVYLTGDIVSLQE